MILKFLINYDLIDQLKLAHHEEFQGRQQVLPKHHQLVISQEISLHA